MEIKREADSNDMTECPHGDQPTSGMFGYFLILHGVSKNYAT